MCESTPTTCLHNQDAIILKDAPIDIFSLDNKDKKEKKKRNKSQLDVYQKYKEDANLQAKNRLELSNCIVDGTRPNYNIPHMNFDDEPLEAMDFERKTKANWNKLANSIIKGKGPKDIQEILKQHFDGASKE